ncbi:hypothetical protein [Rubritalea tangerina]
MPPGLSKSGTPSVSTSPLLSQRPPMKSLVSRWASGGLCLTTGVWCP